MNKIIRAGIYIRVSTDEQAKHGYSIESQRTRLREWCVEHHYAIVDVYADEGKSARSKISNRKELLRLLDDVKSNKVDRIVIWRLDRWFRNVADFYRIQDILDKNDVDWECSDEDYNTSTSNGRLYLNIKLSIAQNESDQTSDRIKFNFDNMVKNKRPISGALPVGYTIEGTGYNKKVVKDPALSQMAIDMFDKFEETLSLRATTEYLIKTYPQRPIAYARVKAHLKNTMYQGLYRGVEDYCEPYITKERQQKIIDLLEKNHKVNKRSEFTYIFSGLLRCHHCKRRMCGTSNGRIHADGTRKRFGIYRCRNYYLNTICTNNKLVTESVLEEWLVKNFLSKLQEYVIDVEQINSNNVSNHVVSQLSYYKGKLNRINELYIDGRISRDKYDIDYKETQDKIAELNKVEDIPSNRDLSKYKKILKSSSGLDLYYKLTPENKRLFWNEYIDHIEQNPLNPNQDFIIFFK